MRKIKGIKRNVLILICVLAALLVIVAVATIAIWLGAPIKEWLMAGGWKYLLTILLTALVCAIVFGIYDEIEDRAYEAQIRELEKRNHELEDELSDKTAEIEILRNRK